MNIDFGMWNKALQGVPRISKDEWDRLDLISRFTAGQTRVEPCRATIGWSRAQPDISNKTEKDQSNLPWNN